MGIASRTACRFFLPSPVKIERYLTGLTGLPSEELTTALDQLHKGCECHTHDLAGDADDELLRVVAAMLRELHKSKGSIGLIHEGVTMAFANRIWKKATEGYGNDLINVDYDTPDHKMLLALQKNVWHFSGAKNYQQIKELSEGLLDENGKVRTFDQFKEFAVKINDKYCGRFLKAEYELAIAGGQMAGKWVDIEANQDEFPLLQFDAVLDAQTTDICRSLDGVIVPWNHAYVKKFYPPNHYGCRLTVKQLSSGKVTKNLPQPEIPEMFRTNLGQSGLVFPKDHPYFVDIPADVLKESKKLIPKADES